MNTTVVSRPPIRSNRTGMQTLRRQQVTPYSAMLTDQNLQGQKSLAIRPSVFFFRKVEDGSKQS